MEIVAPSLKVGAGAAAGGLFIGYAGGIVAGQPAGLFALASSLQCFTLGTSFYASRQVVYQTWGGQEHLSSLDKVKASSIAGGFSGMMGGLLRGPRNILPGIIVGSIVGAGGQAIGGSFSNPHWGDKFLASKYSPVTPLTDRDYEKMLEDKLLKIDAEIAIIDDNIKAVREGAAGRKNDGAKP